MVSRQVSSVGRAELLGALSLLVRVISMRAMQVMVDLVMDLLHRIASEVASILIS